MDGFNVMKQLHHLSELRTGASLRQVLDREREYMEAPFQNRELFHTMTAASVNYHHNSRGKYDDNNNTLTALAAIAPASATVSAADAIFADAMAQSSTALTPHYARQRQRFLTSVLENLSAILTAERHDRAMLMTHQVLAYCRSSEASERSALSKQHQFHLVKYRMQFQRTHLEVLERHHRLPIYQTSAEIRDELHDRCSLEFQELRLRLVLKQLMGHQTSLLQKSAEDWNAVSADRYRSPGMLLAELQKEQRQVQQLLSSLHVAEARQQAQRKDALRKSGGGGERQSPTAPIAVLQTTIARNAPLAAQQLVKGLPATNPRKALVNGVPMNTSHRSDSQDRRNIRGTIL
ncbi:Hypothetical protein, putative [Bodo saltans]|uniref:Uncharacterized protein n=1 Tax=Bodo saltans TaxID=75058 RepID=A0A0S4ISH6_BODSA|nr:Hypothetical protein, putative [Bodo saltans]|eukprot:CUG05865.1 Hypothetical protein, putative [Bodo saltans]